MLFALQQPLPVTQLCFTPTVNWGSMDGEVFESENDAVWHSIQDDLAQIDENLGPQSQVGDFGNAENELFDDEGGTQSSGACNSDSATADGPVLQQHEFDASVSRALLSNCDVLGFKMPWETDFMSQFFDDVDAPLVPPIPVADYLPPLEECDLDIASVELPRVAHHDPNLPIFSTVIASRDGRDPAELAQEKRSFAINKLVRVVQYCLLASTTGRLIATSCQVDRADEDAAEIVNATVGIRSPNTLLSRANALLAFLRFVADKGIDDINPFVEEVVWQYFQHLSATKAAATKQASIMSALRFGFYILGIESLGSALSSRRLVGSAELTASDKRLLRQALPLTVRQLKVIHGMLSCDALHVMDRALAAYLLLACYGRCRHSDLQCVSKVTCDFVDDGGFILIETSVHKCSRSAVQKARLLPILVPTRGVDGSSWGPSAMAVLYDAGANLDGNPDGPLLRAPSDMLGGLKRRGMTSMEVSQILRRFLDLPEPSGGHDSIVSSHSLKVTTLSWASKFGLSPSSRSILGRHSCATNETYAVYSRDLAIGPTNELQAVIDKISRGEFDPDGPRSHMFVTNPAEQTLVPGSYHSNFVSGPIVVKDEPNVPSVAPEVIDVCESSEASDSDSSSSDSSQEHEIKPKVKRFRARIADNEKWFNHVNSQILHRKLDDADKLLACGKRLTKMYVPIDRANEMNSLCKLCNRKRG